MNMDNGAKKTNIDVSGATRISEAVRAAIAKIGKSDLESVRNEVVLTQKITARRSELKAAIREVSKTGAGKTTPNKLTDLERYKLMMFVDNNRDFLKGKTAAEAKDEFAEKFPDIYVVDENIRSACKAIGVELKRVRSRTNQYGRYVNSKELREKIGKLEERVELLERGLAHAVSEFAKFKAALGG